MHAATAKVYYKIMRDKLDHKYKGNRYYNFLVVFVGLFFAAYMIMPDEWRKARPTNIGCFYLQQQLPSLLPQTATEIKTTNM